MNIGVLEGIHNKKLQREEGKREATDGLQGKPETKK